MFTLTIITKKLLIKKSDNFAKKSIMATGILKFFLPKDRVFYTLFESASANLETLSKKLVQLVNEADFNKRAQLVKEMEDLEHQNDLLTHNIFLELGKNFITPFDREDIHSLASALDDIADYMYAAGKKINFYKIDPTVDSGIQKTADAIQQAVLAVNSAVVELRNLKNTQKIVECVIKINSIENTAVEITHTYGALEAHEVIRRSMLDYDLKFKSHLGIGV
jgi:predicted phosphate transport protein (TIGR00153 family)